MLDVEAARMLVRYNAWADRILFDALAAVPVEEVHRSRVTLFGSVIGTLNHNYQVDLIWKAHLQGKAHGFTSRRDMLYSDLGELRAAQSGVNEWLGAWVEVQRERDLAEVIPIRFISGRTTRMQRGAVLLHLCNHKTYHRGWVGQMFYEFDADPPDMDLSVYLCE